MKTAVIYARYSSDRQTEQSIDGQLRVCNDYAQRNDILIVKTYIDRAMSGTNDNRDDFQRMLKDSDRREWDFVLVYKLDRFSRNKYEMAMHRKHLKDNGIKIISAMENIPDSPEGILLESLLEGMNQYYSEELSQKSKRGLNETRLKGNFIGGRVAFGWEKVNHKLIINEQEAAIVREIFDTYLSGKTMNAIAENLTERGIVNKDRPFYGCTIYTMLHNEKYTGIYRVRELVYDKIFPPIISVDTFERVQKKLHENSYGKHVPNVSYLLRGKIDCGYCGKRYVSLGGNDRYGETHRYYICKNTNCGKHKNIRKAYIENAVLYAIRKIVGTEKNLDLIANAIIQRHEQSMKENAVLRLLEKEYASVIKSIAGIMKAIEMGVVTETTKERLEELEKQKRELSENISIEKAKQTESPKKEQIKKYIETALSKSTQEMIDLLIEKVTLYNDKIDITFKYTSKPTPDGDRPKRWHRYCKDSDPNDRGFLFDYYDYCYSYVAHTVATDRHIKIGVYFRV